jgi:hypothetical protein
MTTPAEHFAEAATTHGYNQRATRIMVDAAAALRLPLDEAADWLDVDITPWGSEAWKAQGFADGAEARKYRARGLTPAGAYRDRLDERGRARLAASV